MIYDFIIVGAGSAGCVVAARLSADPSVRVLLLEAGGPDSATEIQIPGAFGKLLKSEFDWDYETVPQPHAHDRSLYVPRGRVLGGSSSINAMIYIRGHRSIYDGWAAAGCAGWSWQDVLPLFKRSERFTGKTSEFHGRKGPLTVSRPRDPNPLSRAFIDAAAEAGMEVNEDFNGETQLGVGLFHLTQKWGKRRSAAAAFLKPAMTRENLDVITGAPVTRVLFAGTRATGVEYRYGSSTEFVAGGHIVLSGGAINTPQLLLLSGVGPADDLEHLDVPVVADHRGVGEGLQDHPVVPLIHACRQPVTLVNGETKAALAKYLLLRKGPLTSNLAEAGAFFEMRPGDAPDFQLHFAPNYFVRHGFDNPEGHGFSLGLTLVLPSSRGRVRLHSSNPEHKPLIDPNCLAATEDVERLMAGLRLGRKVFSGAALNEFRGAEIIPGAAVDSNEQLETQVRSSVELLYHPMSTCRMGTGSEAVVDPQLRVHGLERLSIADASIFPTPINGNTNAPSIMVGEKAAELLLGN